MKKIVITEEEKKTILSMHQSHGYGMVNEQSVEEIKDQKIVNTINTLLKQLLSSPKFGTDSKLFDLIDKKNYVKAYRLHRNLGDSDIVDYELLSDLVDNDETKNTIKRLIPNVQEILNSFYS